MNILQAITIDCPYKIALYNDNNNKTLIKDLYSCYDAKISRSCDSSPTKVIGISNNHMKGKTNDDVRMFYMRYQDLPVIPEGIGKTFPNIVVLRLPFDGILKVTSDDLKLFPNIRFLYLGHNKIKYLPADLFKYTKYLEFVSINNNEITNVGGNIFENLPFVQRFYLHDNKCTEMAFFENRNRLEEVGNEIKQKCPPTKTIPSVTIPNANDAAEIDDETYQKCQQLYYGLPYRAPKTSPDDNFFNNNFGLKLTDGKNQIFARSEGEVDPDKNSERNFISITG